MEDFRSVAWAPAEVASQAIMVTVRTTLSPRAWAAFVTLVSVVEPVEVANSKPFQIPSWHLYVGHYYQYPSPWTMDWKRHLGRSVFYWLSRIERLVRLGSIGAFAPNLVAVARKRHVAM